jgi:hypothetical protein
MPLSTVAGSGNSAGLTRGWLPPGVGSVSAAAAA